MDFMTAVTNVGVATACLAALGISLWQGLKWVGINIVKPVAERHVKFLDDLTQATASQSQAMQTMSIQQGKNLESSDRMMERISLMLERQNEMLLKQGEMIEKQDMLIRTLAIDGNKAGAGRTAPPKGGS